VHNPRGLAKGHQQRKSLLAQALAQQRLPLRCGLSGRGDDHHSVAIFAALTLGTGIAGITGIPCGPGGAGVSGVSGIAGGAGISGITGCSSVSGRARRSSRTRCGNHTDNRGGNDHGRPVASAQRKRCQRCGNEN
jgi:hypothetical protein